MVNVTAGRIPPWLPSTDLTAPACDMCWCRREMRSRARRRSVWPPLSAARDTGSVSARQRVRSHWDPRALPTPDAADVDVAVLDVRRRLDVHADRIAHQPGRPIAGRSGAHSTVNIRRQSPRRARLDVAARDDRGPSLAVFSRSTCSNAGGALPTDCRAMSSSARARACRRDSARAVVVLQRLKRSARRRRDAVDRATHAWPAREAAAAAHSES